MSTPLILHYAPDNASLCVRLALEALGTPYKTRLVDLSAKAQRSATYMALNPNGLIPVLETPDGALFETGAILLWLSDRYPGALMPATDDPARGAALTWLFWLSNTLHPALQMLFYPTKFMPADPDGQRAATRARIMQHLDVLDAANPAFLSTRAATAAGCYLAPMLRWAGLYGGDTSWFDLSRTPRLSAFATHFEDLPAAQAAAQAEGLGAQPFSAPQPCNPPEGVAL